ncbi:MAG: polymer-forming cytoskeletal protein [Chloroflexi bacterium]|nr:polymer-forming cytoskeletal protein [Chloroflexota bacterium]
MTLHKKVGLWMRQGGSGNQVETVLGSTTSFQGTIRSDNTVRVFGVVHGDIEAATLVIGKSAQVMANVVAHNVQVAGAIRGNITAVGGIEILAGGQVCGDVHSPSLVVEAGALFMGQSVMNGPDAALPLLEAGASDPGPR